MNCIIFAVFLPNLKKKYVLEEIFSYIKIKEKYAKIFIGIQHNSIPETEEILRKMKGNLDIEVRRVPEHMVIDSDASSFITALQLYAESDMDFDWVYFIHTKGITSNNDPLRKVMYDLIFDKATIEKRFENNMVGSYAPYITLTDVQEDIDKMSCMTRFNPEIFDYPVMEYYYINTFFVIRSKILADFIETVSTDFFDTNILTYSDRYMMERDFAHIVDMMGYLPSAKFYHGNYSTNYVAPTDDKYQEKLLKWYEEIKHVQ